MRRPLQAAARTLRATLLLLVLAAPAALADHFGVEVKGERPDEEPTTPTNCPPGADPACCPPPQSQQENACKNNDPGAGPVAYGGDPVDAWTGRQTLEVEDLVVNGVVPIRMVRQYNSQSRYDSPVGYGWSFTYDTRVFEKADSSVVVRSWEGRRLHYDPPSGGSNPETLQNADPANGTIPELKYFSPPTSEGVEYMLTHGSGDRALFDTEGRLYALETPQGNRLRFFYSAEKQPLAGMSPFALDPTQSMTVGYFWQLVEIREQLAHQVGPDQFTGREVDLVYDGNGRVDHIESHDGRRVDYDHQETSTHPEGPPPVPGYRGNLAQVTGPYQHPDSASGVVQTYRYPATPGSGTSADFGHIHNLTYYDDGAGTEPHTATYDPATDRVASQQYGDAAWSFDYVVDELTGIQTTTIDRTIVTPGQPDATATTIYTFDLDGFLTEKVDAVENRIEYDHFGASPETRVYDAPPPGGGTESLNRTTAFTFDTSGRISTREVLLSGTGDTVTTTREYEGAAAAFLKKLETTSTASTDVFTTEIQYFLKADGTPQNIKKVSRGDGVAGVLVDTTFTYHSAHKQLEKVIFPDVLLPDGSTDHLEINRIYYTAAEDVPPLILNGLVKEIQVVSDDGTTVTTGYLRRGFKYDAAGNVTEITDARDHVTELEWDARNRLIRSTERIGATAADWQSTLFRYGAPTGTGCANVTTATPGLHLLEVEVGALGSDGTATEGHVRRIRRDSRGNAVAICAKNSAGSWDTVSTHTYDSDDNRVKSSEPREDGTDRVTTFGFDAMGQLKSVTDHGTNQTVFEYDALGNRTKVTDAKSNATDFVYDELDRLVTVIQQGQSLTTAFGYDAVGNVTKVTDPKNQVTTYDYDELSRLDLVTQQLGQTVDYEYDDRGRLEKVINARGEVLRYFYFPWGGLAKILYDADDDGLVDSGEREIDHTYDFDGNILTASDEEISGAPLWTFTYDALDRVDLATASSIPGAPSLDSDYDRFGNRETLTLVDAQGTSVQRWRYDARERLVAACMPQDEPCPLDDETVRLLYGGSELDQITHDNGAQSDLVTNLAYHDEGPLQSISVGAAPLHELVYTLDPVLNVDTVAETLDGTAQSPLYDFDYDDVYRLTDAAYPAGVGIPFASETFPYDPAGNRNDAGTLWEYDANNRIEASPGLEWLLDADGNTCRTSANPIDRSGTEPCANPVLSGEVVYTYDATNRLRSISAPGTTTVAHSYRYDPFGRRLEKSTGGTTTWYLWDGDQLLAEYDGSGSRKVRYAYAGGFAPAQVAYDDGAGGETVYHVHTDHLDTPRMLTDASGAARWRAAYEAFGLAHVSSDPDGDANPANNVASFNIRFPGQYFDAETGLHYNRHRYYSPKLGRYISSDPIGQYGGLNTYTYAELNPIVNLDWNGLGPIKDGPGPNRPPNSYLLYKRALRRSDDLFPPGSGQSRAKSDFQHCLASCEIAKAHGQGTATFWGNVNEIFLGKGIGSQDNAIDQAANRYGRALASDPCNPPDCDKECQSFARGPAKPPIPRSTPVVIPFGAGRQR